MSKPRKKVTDEPWVISGAKPKNGINESLEKREAQVEREISKLGKRARVNGSRVRGR